MNISDYETKGIQILELSGRFDSDYKVLQQQLSELIKGNNKVIVDCKELFYINSSGLRVLLMLLKEVSKDKGKLVFCNLNDNLKNVFRITGFIHLFLVFNSKEEAIENILIGK